jgi:hypothetical protein
VGGQLHYATAVPWKSCSREDRKLGTSTTTNCTNYCFQAIIDQLKNRKHFFSSRSVETAILEQIFSVAAVTVK